MEKRTVQVAESSECLSDEPETEPANSAVHERPKAEEGWPVANGAACSSTLFEPVRFGRLTTKNRLMRAATYTGLADGRGYPTAELTEAYVRLTQGGVGTIITGLTSIAPDGNPYPHAEALHDETYTAAWRTTVDHVHEHGAAIVLQLVHAGSAAKGLADGVRPVAPSAVLNPKSGIVPEEATTAELQRIAAAFAAAAARARAAGFDGVEMHAAHGYLLSQFLDPRLNQRTDRYGGSPERRAQFVVECVSAVREAVGESFPVLVKLNSSDGAEGGLSEEESLACALQLIARSATAIEVSGAWRAAGQAARRTSTGGATAGEPYFTEFALRLAAATDAPVILTGGCRSAASLERLAKQGIAAFGLGRPLVCEPDLPQRWREDAAYKPRCTSCDGCSRSAAHRCVLSEN